MRFAFGGPSLVLLLSLACGGGSTAPSTATSPSTSTPPSSSGPAEQRPANVGGTWSGTLEAPGFATRRIVLLAFQSGTCVDGAWRTEPAEWVGAISGYADVGSFSGSITIGSADGSNRCAGVGTASGAVGTGDIRWSLSGFTGQCPGGLPQSVQITLSRDS